MVLAGPNGAGKSTFFDLYLRGTGLRFVNADLIARALTPENPGQSSYEAAKAADLARQALVARGDSFCTETVFSDPHGTKLDFLRSAQVSGYRVLLLFIGLESPELSQARVLERVAAGGHDVPDEKIFARFPRTLANLAAALQFVDEARLYDNSDANGPYRLVARILRGGKLETHPPIPSWAERVLDRDTPEPRPRSGGATSTKRRK